MLFFQIESSQMFCCFIRINDHSKGCEKKFQHSSFTLENPRILICLLSLILMFDYQNVACLNHSSIIWNYQKKNEKKLQRRQEWIQLGFHSAPGFDSIQSLLFEEAAALSGLGLRGIATKNKFRKEILSKTGRLTQKRMMDKFDY